MEFKLSNHAKRRLYQRYGIKETEVLKVDGVALNDAIGSYWLVLNGQTDALAIIKNGVLVTLLHFHHKLSSKTFGL